MILREPPGSRDYLEGLWDEEILEPEVASGGFDPLEETVNVQLDVFSVSLVWVAEHTRAERLLSLPYGPRFIADRSAGTGLGSEL